MCQKKNESNRNVRVFVCMVTVIFVPWFHTPTEKKELYNNLLVEENKTQFGHCVNQLKWEPIEEGKKIKILTLTVACLVC